MLSKELKSSKEILASLPQPTRIIISGLTRSGKTYLAQQLAKQLNVNTEVWATPVFFCDLPFPQYTLIPSAPIYTTNSTSGDWEKEMFKVWQERSSYIRKSFYAKKCIIIDEVRTEVLKINSSGFPVSFLLSRLNQNTSIILTTQDFDGVISKNVHTISKKQKHQGLEYIKKLSLDYYNQLNFNKLKFRFSVIRLGWEAEEYVEYTLKDRSLLWQVKSAKYACLIGNKVVDLAH